MDSCHIKKIVSKVIGNVVTFNRKKATLIFSLRFFDKNTFLINNKAGTAHVRAPLVQGVDELGHFEKVLREIMILLVAAVIIATIGAVFMLLIGVVAYGLEITPSALPAAAITFVVSVICFAALGTAVASAVPTASAASSVANATILPLAFVSNVFIPLDDPPRWLDVIGDVFPLKPFVESFQAAFHPTAAATSPDIGSLLVVFAWGVGGMLIALRRFRWDTPAGGSTRRRRRQRST